MKRKLVALVLAGFVVIAAPFTGMSWQDDKPMGVKGDLVVIKDQDDQPNPPVKIGVGDRIELAVSYPSGQLKAASAKSDNAAVKFHEIRTLRFEPPSKLIGSQLLGAFFTAEQEGKASLECNIKLITGDKVMKCDVEVAK